MTIWLEGTRAAVLALTLEKYPDQSTRPVWVHHQLDKLSQGWILSLPGYNGFSQDEFSETVARYMCLPSPLSWESYWSSIEGGRGRQGLLPDFRLDITYPAGEPEQRLAEQTFSGPPEMVPWPEGEGG